LEQRQGGLQGEDPEESTEAASGEQGGVASQRVHRLAIRARVRFIPSTVRRRARPVLRGPGTWRPGCGRSPLGATSSTGASMWPPPARERRSS